MTRKGTLLAILGLFVLFGMVAPASAAGWADSADYDHARWQGPGNGHGHSGGGVFHFSPKTSKIAKLGVTAAGSIVAGIFGSQFGTIGTVIGGAAGFFVSKWVGEKLFGKNGYPHSYNHGGQSLFSKIKNFFTGDNDRDRGGMRWSQINTSMGGDGANVATLRQEFYSAMEDFKQALASGSQADKETARARYDAARNAFEAAKNHR